MRISDVCVRNYATVFGERKARSLLPVCAPAPFQAAGVTALGLPEAYYEAMMAQYETRRAILLEALDGAYYVMADFGEIVWPRERYMRPGWTEDRAFAEYLAREVGVAVVPGASFYAGAGDGMTRVRLNFAKRAGTLREAARRLEAGL